MTSIQAIVFDLDDTLFPEREYAFSGFRAVAVAFAGPLGADPDESSARMRALFDTPQRGWVFDALLEAVGIQGEPARMLVTEMIAAYRGHLPTIGLLPDADRALTRLRGRYRLGILSDGYRQTQENKITALGLRERVEEIILTDNWGRPFWKPHPRAFEEIGRTFDLPPGACLYVADNPTKDFLAPNALGWRTVFIRRHGALYARCAAPLGGTAHAVIDSLDAIVAP